MKGLFPKVGALAVVVTLLLLGLVALSHGNDTTAFFGFNRSDLVAFWSGVHALSHGQCPYYQDALLAAQRLTGIEGPILTGNPPWTLMLLYPLLSFPFHLALVGWLFMNVLLLLLSAALAQEYFIIGRDPQRKHRPETQWDDQLPVLLSTFCFIPSYALLITGQLTAFVLFFLFVSLCLLRSGRDLWAGVALVPVSMKPHLVSLVMLGIFAKILIEKRFRFIAGFLLGVAFLCFELIVIRPRIFIEWAHSASTAHNQITSTLVSVVRQKVQEYWGVVPVWPVVVIPLVAMVVAVVCIICKARAHRFNLEESLPYLLSLSLLFAPHAWLYDYVLLLGLFIPLLDFSRQDAVPMKHRLCVVGLLVLTQVSIVVASIFDTNCASYFWFPALMTLVWHSTIKMRSQCRVHSL